MQISKSQLKLKTDCFSIILSVVFLFDWTFIYGQSNCITMNQLMKMHRVSISEIQPFLNGSSWSFDAAKSKVNSTGFKITNPMEYVKWTRSSYQASETLELYTCLGKPNLIKLVTNDACFRIMSESFSTITPGETKVVDGALLTIYSSGNTIIEIFTQKAQYNKNTYTLLVYDRAMHSRLAFEASLTDAGNPFYNEKNGSNTSVSASNEDAPTQAPTSSTDEGEVVTYVEVAPRFPGGESALYAFLQKNIKYPPLARENGITGRVYLTFIIGLDGSIRDVKVVRGIGAGCDEEAIRVIKNMPRWEAGKQNGKPVNVQFNMPINFTLN